MQVIQIIPTFVCLVTGVGIILLAVAFILHAGQTRQLKKTLDPKPPSPPKPSVFARLAHLIVDDKPVTAGFWGVMFVLCSLLLLGQIVYFIFFMHHDLLGFVFLVIGLLLSTGAFYPLFRPDALKWRNLPAAPAPSSTEDLSDIAKKVREKYKP